MRRTVLALLALPAAAALLAAPSARGADKPDLALTVATSGIVRGPSNERLGFLRGSALAFEGELDRYDVVFVIDVSGSTADPSGADIDGDGNVSNSGRRSRFLNYLPFLRTRPRGSGDSILAAEVASVRALLKTFDPRNTRAALVSFAGGQTDSPGNAILDVPLTSEFRELREGLDQILAAGAEGATDMQAGLRVARNQLIRSAGIGAARAKRKRAQQHVVLLTDGVPLVPFESGSRSEERAVEAAQRMGKDGIRVHVYALGPEAVQRPRAAVAIAEESGGEFRAVEKPADVTRLLPELRFARIEEVRVVPLDVPGEPLVAERSENGDYSVLVPVRNGDNRVEIYARSSDGREKKITATIAAGEPELSQDERSELSRMIEVRAMQRAQEERARKRSLEIESKP